MRSTLADLETEPSAVGVNFVVARNPDSASRLPFLVRLPIDGGLILKVRDTWPRTSRVFCARMEGGWPSNAEIVEEVPVAACRRRGIAIDLVLVRPRENRSRRRRWTFGQAVEAGVQLDDVEMPDVVLEPSVPGRSRG